MARRRNTSEADWLKIQASEAVGEAFGYYFNEQGNVVHKVRTVGMQLRTYKMYLTLLQSLEVLQRQRQYRL